MRKAALLFLFLILPFISMSSPAASFDCKKARTATEKAICASSELSKLDDEMAVNYKAALSLSTRVEAAFLRTHQKRWLAERDKYCESRTICLLDTYRTQIATLGNRQRCVEFSQILDKPRGVRPKTLTQVESSSREGGDTKYFGVDIDADGVVDEILQSCGSRDMPCNLFITLSAGGEMELEEGRFYLARYRGDLIVIVGDAAFEGRKAGAPRNRSIYQVKKTGIDLICRHI